MSRACWLLTIILGLSVNGQISLGHEGPDPRACWLFDSAFLDGSRLTSQSGPNLEIVGGARSEKVGKLNCMRLDGNESYFIAQDTWDKVRSLLPVGQYSD